MLGDTLDELKARIVSAMDVTDFLDFCGLDFVNVIDVLMEVVDEETIAKLDRSCR